jgi:formate dehydrogenase accessory protein FdhE
MDFWEKQIARATLLAGNVEGANELLRFYRHLVTAQRQVYLYCSTQNALISGELAQDVVVLRPVFGAILWAVEEAGPPPLVEQAQTLKGMAEEEIDQMLVDYWHQPSDTEFFAKAFLQPYGQHVASTASQLFLENTRASETRCPFCGGKPQLSILQSKEGGGESGNRDLMCAKCLWVWTFRRAVCANCGEEQPARLAYFQSPSHDHVRVEACDTCKKYLKAVDLTRLGVAEPLVDEVAAAPLDLWATEHGYTKIELNLVGL